MPEAKPGGFQASLPMWRWILVSEWGLGAPVFVGLGEWGASSVWGGVPTLAWHAGPLPCVARGFFSLRRVGVPISVGRGSPSLCREGLPFSVRHWGPISVQMENLRI